MRIRCPHCDHENECPTEPDLAPNCGGCGKPITLFSPDGAANTVTHQSTQTTPMADLPASGARIGNFVLQHQLGLGSFGAVYSAFDTVLHRQVAIKVPRRRPTEKQLSAFLREARSAARVNADNIVKVHEVGVSLDNIYIVSELIDGPTLSNWMKSRRPSFVEVATVCRDIARGLAKAHAAGVVHRDLKPGNVLMDAEHRPHITDFGLSSSSSVSEETIATPGHLLGTPAYMSPEQASRRPDLADARSDIFSLGVMLFELVSGKRPFTGTNSEDLVDAIRSASRQALLEARPDAPPELQAVCDRALRKEPSERYKTADEFADDLQRFIDGEIPRAFHPTPRQRATRWLRKRWPAVAFGVGILVALTSALWQLSGSAPGTPTPPPEPRIHITLRSSPDGAEVALTLFDGDTHQPGSRRFVGTTPLSIDVPPGRYHVAARVSGHGFLETERRAPDRPTRIPGGNGVGRQWKPDGSGDGVVLPPLIIPKTADAPPNAALVPGAQQYRLVREVSSARLAPEPAPVAPFYLQLREVTCREYRQVMGRLPLQLRDADPLDDAPVTYVDFWDAQTYAERIGMRLPTAYELDCAATSGGLQRYPWGGDAKRWDPLRPQDGEALASYDITPNTGIRDLLTAPAEWSWTTPSLEVPTQRGPSRELPPELIDELKITRIVFGGDATVLELAATAQAQHARWCMESMNHRYPGLGFRCARSADLAADAFVSSEGP